MLKPWSSLQHQSISCGLLRSLTCLSSVNIINTMTRLLLGAVLLGNLGVTVQVPVPLAPPSQVRFDSVDYKNILRWTLPANSSSSASLQYYVQWKIYGEPQWLDVDSCQGIQELQCDLSDETSDTREWYYARVHAASPPSNKSAWKLSPRFSPRWDTEISPPTLKLHVVKQRIVVRAKSPSPHVRKMHSSLEYKIYLVHPSGEEEVFEMDCCLKKLTLRELDLNTKYCLQAQILIPQQAKSSARGPMKCVTTL